MLGSAILKVLNVSEINVKIYHLHSTRMEELRQVTIWRTSLLFVADSALCLINEPLADILKDAGDYDAY